VKRSALTLALLTAGTPVLAHRDRDLHLHASDTALLVIAAALAVLVAARLAYGSRRK